MERVSRGDSEIIKKYINKIMEGGKRGREEKEKKERKGWSCTCGLNRCTALAAAYNIKGAGDWKGAKACATTGEMIGTGVVCVRGVLLEFEFGVL